MNRLSQRVAEKHFTVHRPTAQMTSFTSFSNQLVVKPLRMSYKLHTCWHKSDVSFRFLSSSLVREDNFWFILVYFAMPFIWTYVYMYEFVVVIVWHISLLTHSLSATKEAKICSQHIRPTISQAGRLRAAIMPLSLPLPICLPVCCLSTNVKTLCFVYPPTALLPPTTHVYVRVFGQQRSTAARLCAWLARLARLKFLPLSGWCLISNNNNLCAYCANA